MDNNLKILLAILCVLALYVLYMKEGFAGGMPQRSSRIEKLMVPVSSVNNLKGNLKGNGQPNFENAKSVNFANYTNVQARPTVQYPYQSSAQGKAYVQEGYEGGSSGSYLGSSANTNLPYVSQPNFQQTTPLKAPSVQYSSYERFRPTSPSNMGRTEAFNCQSGNGSGSVEGFTTVEGMDNGVNSYPGVDYAAGNYNQMEAAVQPSEIAATLSSTMDVLNATGDTTQVMVYDRPYTVNLKAGRTNRAPGTVDYIRGDLPVNVSDNRSGWFQASGGPTDLVVGALTAISGQNEADHVLKAMKKGYGSLSNNGVQASKDFNYAPMQFANMQNGLSDTTQITSTAFP